MDNKNYSVRFALKELEQAIKEVSKEVSELENTIKALDKPVDSMVLEYYQKKNLLNSLLKRKEKLESSTKSFGLTGGYRYGRIAKNDNKISKYDDNIKELEQKIKSIPDSSNRKVSRAKASLINELNALKSKKGNMETRQKALTDKKLIEDIKLLKRKGKQEGTKAAGEFLSARYQDDKEEHLDNMYDLVNSNAFKAMGEFFKFLHSARKEKTIKIHTALLAKMQGIAFGATKFSGSIKHLLRDPEDIVIGGRGR